MSDKDETTVTRPSQPSDWACAARVIAGGRLSVIMPAFNLGPVILANIREVHSLLRGKAPFEIVAVDDGSCDNTKDEILKAAAALPEVKPVLLAKNAGKGAALKHGFEASTGTHIVFLDADLDLPPHQMWRLFDVMEREKSDIVIGSKRHPDSVLSYPWYRRVISATYFALVKLLMGLSIRDTQTGLKMFKRAPLEWAFQRMLVRQFAYDLELLAIANEQGFKISESPVTLEFRGTLGCVRPGCLRQIITDTLAIFYRLKVLGYYRAVRDVTMPDPRPLVSIVVACPAPTAYLEEVVRGIQNQTYRELETIILPDESSGRTWPAGFREIPTGRIRPAEKRNTGIEAARGGIVAFLDDDAFPVEDWLTHAIVHFTDKTVAAVGGPAVTPGNDPYMAKLGGRVYANPLVSGNYRYRYIPGRVLDVEDFPSCNLFVRTDVLRNIGGFRADFWPGEDTYLCMELVKRLKLRIVYDPRVHVFHHRRKLFLPHLRQIGRYAIHRGYFARKFPSTSRKLSYMIPSLFVFGLIAGGIVSAFSPLFAPIYLAALALYVLLTAISCVSVSPAKWIICWLGVVLTHIVYGVRFAAGIVMPRMPGEVRSFDHPSEEARAAGP